jgi:hypothetical protein
MGRTRVPSFVSYSRGPEPRQDSIDCVGRHKGETFLYYRCEDVVVSSQRTYLDRG